MVSSRMSRGCGGTLGQCSAQGACGWIVHLATPSACGFRPGRSGRVPPLGTTPGRSSRPGCAGHHKETHVTSFDLAEYRRRAEEFTGALDYEAYQHYGGPQGDCDFTSVYDRYPELFTLDAVRTLRRLYDAGRRRRGPSPALVPARLRHRGVPRRRDQGAHRRDRQRRKPGPRSRSTAKRSATATRASCRPTSPTASVAAASTGARLEVTGRTLNPLYDSCWRRLHDLVGRTRLPRLPHPLLRGPRSRLRPPARRHRRLPARDRGPLPAHARQGLAGQARHRPRGARVLRPALPHAGARVRPHLPQRAAAAHVRAHPAGARASRWPTRPTCTSTPRRASSSRRARSAHRCACPTRSTSWSCPRADRTTFRRCSTRAATPSTSPTPIPSCRSSTASSATTRSPRASPSSSTTCRSTRAGSRRTSTTPSRASSSPSPTSSSSTSCAATPASSPTRPSSTCRPGRSTTWPSATASCSAAPSRSRCRPTTTWSTSTRASTPPTTCAPGCSKGRCGMLLQDDYGMEWFREPAAGRVAQEALVDGAALLRRQLLLKNGGGKLDMGPLRVHLERALGR